MKTKTKNLFTEILKDFWGEFTQKHTGYATDYYDSIIEKTINCGDPKFGYVEYGCMCCGNSRHRVAFTCKTKFCLRCGRVSSENFVVQVMNKLHLDIVYRHLILTIPEQLYSLFYKNRHDKKLYNLFYQCGPAFIEDVFSQVTNKKLKIGCIVVLHTAGRKGNYRPHLHVIVMNGGVDMLTGQWVNIPYFPYEKILPKKWQYHLLKMVQGFDNSALMNKLAEDLYRKYPNGFVNFFMKGDVPKNSQRLVKYLSKYLFRPSISLKRILKYDKEKKKVEYEYADHRSKSTKKESVDVFEFIGRMVQQILPKGFQRARYYGLQATASYQKSKEIIMKSMVDKVVDGVSFVARKLFYRDRMKIWTGKDPLICSSCGSKMELIKIWSRDKGIIYDLLDIYKNMGRSPPGELLSLKTVDATTPVEIIEDYQLELGAFGLAWN